LSDTGIAINRRPDCHKWQSGLAETY